MAAPTVGWDAISPADLALRAADVPLLIAQAIPISPSVAKWTEVGTGAAADRTLSTSPVSLAYDGKPHYVTKPDSTVSSTWYFYFDVSNVTAGIVVDCGLIIGHNFDTIGDVTSIKLQVADNAAWTTNPRDIGSFTLRGSDKRIADLALYHIGSDPLRYKDIHYVRLEIIASTSMTPEVGELVLGRSRQLEKHPMLPYDDLTLAHAIDEIESDDGVLSGLVRYQRRGDVIGRLLLSESAGVADIRAWYRQVRASFAWIWEPDAEPDDWQLMWLRSKMRAPHAGFTSRVLPIDAIEQGPERFFLDVEVR